MKLDGLMMTRQKFSKSIESVVKEKKVSYLDAVVLLCDVNNLEPDDIKKYISSAVKNKLESEAIRLNMMQEKNRSIELE